MSNSNTSFFDGRAGTIRRRRAPWLAAAIGALVIGVAGAAAPLTTIEECIETGTDLVSLPGTAGGSLSAKACASCDSVRLRFDSNTHYFIGDEAVPYARLREAASRGTQSLYVFYRPDTKIMTRVRIDAVGPSK
jgi:hypothetical protein